MSKLKLKVIKSKEFNANDEQHTHYTVAYKGRVFGISTLRFPKENIAVEDTTMTIDCDVELLKSTSVDQITGEITTYVDIVPKLDIALAGI